MDCMSREVLRLIEAAEALCAAYGTEPNLSVAERIVELGKLAKKARKAATESKQ
jgi:hypothetical protein